MFKIMTDGHFRAWTEIEIKNQVLGGAETESIRKQYNTLISEKCKDVRKKKKPKARTGTGGSTTNKKKTGGGAGAKKKPTAKRTGGRGSGAGAGGPTTKKKKKAARTAARAQKKSKPDDPKAMSMFSEFKSYPVWKDDAWEMTLLSPRYECKNLVRDNLRSNGDFTYTCKFNRVQTDDCAAFLHSVYVKMTLSMVDALE